MTRDEQRQAWRTYAAAALSTFRNAEYTNGDIESVEDVADRLLKAELQRFDSPDHSGDADKMVEPRPWVGLTDAERSEHIIKFVGGVLTTPKLYALLEKVEQQLKVKNGGRDE